MADDIPANEAQLYTAFKKVVEVFLPLDKELRSRAYTAVGSFFGYGHADINGTTAEPGPLSSPPSSSSSSPPSPSSSSPASSSSSSRLSPPPTPAKPAARHNAALSPKAFLAQKKPSTDVERIACFAYYLRRHRNTPRFKTADIKSLAEEARITFGNMPSAVNNAARAGFVATASRGMKQLTTQGEKYVDTLPDRTAAKQLMRKRKARRQKSDSEPPSDKSKN